MTKLTYNIYETWKILNRKLIYPTERSTYFIWEANFVNESTKSPPVTCGKDVLFFNISFLRDIWKGHRRKFCFSRPVASHQFNPFQTLFPRLENPT